MAVVLPHQAARKLGAVHPRDDCLCRQAIAAEPPSGRGDDFQRTIGAKRPFAPPRRYATYASVNPRGTLARHTAGLDQRRTTAPGHPTAGMRSAAATHHVVPQRLQSSRRTGAAKRRSHPRTQHAALSRRREMRKSRQRHGDAFRRPPQVVSRHRPREFERLGAKFIPVPPMGGGSQARSPEQHARRR